MKNCFKYGSQESAEAFLAYIRSVSGLSFGRMMQIISHEWHRVEPDLSCVVGEEYRHLPDQDARIYERVAHADPLNYGERLHPWDFGE